MINIMVYTLCSFDFPLYPWCYRALATAGLSSVNCCEQVCVRVVHFFSVWITLCITLPFSARGGDGRFGRRYLYLRAVPLRMSWNGKRGTAVRTGGRPRVRGIALGSGNGNGRCVAAWRDGVPFASFWGTSVHLWRLWWQWRVRDNHGVCATDWAVSSLLNGRPVSTITFLNGCVWAGVHEC